MSAIHWGDVPTWVTGILTGSAVLVNALGLGTEVKRTRRDRKEQTAAQIRSQAELISAWTHNISQGVRAYIDACAKNPPEGRFDPNLIGCTVSLRISNASHLPAYRLRYRFGAGNRGTFVGQLAVLPPRTVAELAIPLPSNPREDEPIPEVAFTDAAGRHWQRTVSGTLTGPSSEAVGFGPCAGAFPSVAEHPTMAMPHAVHLQPVP